MDQTRKAHCFLVEKTLGKCPVGRIEKKCEDKIQTERREICCKDGMQILSIVLDSRFVITMEVLQQTTGEYRTVRNVLPRLHYCTERHEKNQQLYVRQFFFTVALTKSHVVGSFMFPTSVLTGAIILCYTMFIKKTYSVTNINT